VFQQYTQWLVKAKQERLKNRFKFKMLKGGTKTVLEYWKIDGENFHALQKVALTVFGIMNSSAASERNFSTMGFVHNKLRNSLGKDGVEKLVFIKSNAPFWEQKPFLIGTITKTRMVQRNQRSTMALLTPLYWNKEL
jgi:hypothetical protein